MPMPGLTLKSLGHHPSLAPLFIAVGGGAVLGGIYLARLASRNPDVSWDRKNNPHPWQKMKQTDQYKFMCVSGDYKTFKFPAERPDI